MSRLPFQGLLSAWPKMSLKIIIFHSWRMGNLLGIYLTATEQLLGYFQWCQGHWFGDGAKVMPAAFFLCKGPFREVLNGRASYTSVNVGKVHPRKHRSKDSNAECKQGCKIKWERLIFPGYLSCCISQPSHSQFFCALTSMFLQLVFT